MAKGYWEWWWEEVDAWCKNQPLSGEQKQVELEQQMLKAQSPLLTQYPSSQKSTSHISCKEKKVVGEDPNSSEQTLWLKSLCNCWKRGKKPGIQSYISPNGISYLFPWCCLHLRTWTGTGRSVLEEGSWFSFVGLVFFPSQCLPG